MTAFTDTLWGQNMAPCCTEDPLTGQMVGGLFVVLFLILNRVIQKNNDSGAKMPYVTNPYLIPHHGTAVSGQIIITIEKG